MSGEDDQEVKQFQKRKAKALILKTKLTNNAEGQSKISEKNPLHSVYLKTEIDWNLPDLFGGLSDEHSPRITTDVF